LVVSYLRLKASALGSLSFTTFSRSFAFSTASGSNLEGGQLYRDRGGVVRIRDIQRDGPALRLRQQFG
jgi:hypothetical protein